MNIAQHSDRRFRGEIGIGSIVHDEPEWRRPRLLVDGADVPGKVVASRWIDLRAEKREVAAEIEGDYHTIGISLKTTTVSASVAGRVIHDGPIAAGALQVSGPAQPTRATFRGPCDVLHLHVSNRFLAECYEEARERPLNDDIRLRDPCFARDPLVEQFGRALTQADSCGSSFGALHAEGIILAIVSHMLASHSSEPLWRGRRATALAKWRLRRAIDYVESHIDQAISLSDFAASAGLSRMYFANQFRVSTGMRPHEYLLLRRIEKSQELMLSSRSPLVDIALSVGFQSQSHFSTVFKRIVGDTPNRWRSERCRECQPCASA
jgi:AraC-like DNA-binding protein